MQLQQAHPRSSSGVSGSPAPPECRDTAPPLVTPPGCPGRPNSPRRSAYQAPGSTPGMHRATARDCRFLRLACRSAATHTMMISTARSLVFLCSVLLLSACASGGVSPPEQPGTAPEAQERLPILDMHMHARLARHYGPNPGPLCAPVVAMPFWDPAHPIEEGLRGSTSCREVLPAATDAAVLGETLAAMERHNIIGVLGGAPELVKAWRAAAPGRFIPGLDFRLDRATGTATAAPDGASYRPVSPDSIRALHRRGDLAVLGEVLNQYGGIAPDDPRMEPYWALAEELDLPVGIHIGPGGPGEFYFGNRAYRTRLQSALTLEEVLIRHPRLRVYVMHAGYPMLDDLRAMLFSHPQLYVEVSMLVNVEPRPAFYRYLQELVDAGYGDRIMFGSDQMVWPGLIDAAVRSIEEAPFLTHGQKRDIFYNNAARFLRLTPEEIARHHGR
ncbi:MAG TPA: amidohydrolase family protein [Longimicrobiaceae bacterium]|nr:amidohydrolase family protein [Longimicrobiaceae bacterium]